MIIKNVETGLDGACLIRALLAGQFNYNPVCKCGTTQTYDGCKQMIKTAKSKGKGIDHDFECSQCRKQRPCTVFGVTYPSVKEAAEKSYDPEKCVCEVCHKQISKTQWYQWCQRYLDGNDGRIVCHSCKSSEVRTELNVRDHDKLSQQVRERNLKNWQDPEYVKARSKQQSIVANRMWADPEKVLTLKKTLSSEDDPLWDKPNSWQSILIGRTPFKYESYKSTFEQCKAFIDTVTKLHAKYKNIYSEPVITNDEERAWVNGARNLLDTHGLFYDTYLNFISRYPTKRGNHHVLLRSIEENDFYKVAVGQLEHAMAHFLLVLDNLCLDNAPDILTENGLNLTQKQMQIFAGFSRVGYTNAHNLTDKAWRADIQSILYIPSLEEDE